MTARWKGVLPFEGRPLARQYNAEVFLLFVLVDHGALLLPEAALAATLREIAEFIPHKLLSPQLFQAAIKYFAFARPPRQYCLFESPCHHRT